MIANIPENENHVIYFRRIQGSDFYVENCGYNNFKYIEGLNIKRKQSFYTMHFILSGEGILEIGGKCYNLHKGDIFCCGKDVLFSYYPLESNPWEYVWIEFGGNIAENLIAECCLSAENAVLTGRLTRSIYLILENLFYAAQSNHLPSAYRAVSAFYAILSELTDFMSVDKSSKVNKIRYVENAKRYIEQNYFNPEFKIEHISKIIYVSHSYLCRIFLTETGKTLIQYLIDYRLSKAKMHLIESADSVKKISGDCGYGDYSHFCKVFFAREGMNPTDYRVKNHDIIK